MNLNSNAIFGFFITADAFPLLKNSILYTHVQRRFSCRHFKPLLFTACSEPISESIITAIFWLNSVGRHKSRLLFHQLAGCHVAGDRRNGPEARAKYFVLLFRLFRSMQIFGFDSC